jgi:phage tail-like protein
VDGDNNTNFRYLNRDGVWPGFKRSGLELLSDGSVALYSLPILEGDLPQELESLAAPEFPGGIAVDADGTIYYTDPDGDRVRRIGGCTGLVEPVPCVGGHGHAPGQFDQPGGLFIPNYRRSLFVTDGGNHRVQVFDLSSMQLVDIWGQRSVTGIDPSSDAGRFDTPCAIGGDSDGNIYVVEIGNKRIQKFDRVGRVVPSFWNRIRERGLLNDPIGVSVTNQESRILVYVLDRSLHCTFVFDASGEALTDDAGKPISIGSDVLKQPLAIESSDDSIYIGDNEARRIFVFKPEDGYAFAGDAVGYDGPVEALELDGKGQLLVEPGSDLPPIALAARSGFSSSGALWSKAIKVRENKVTWHRLKSLLTRTGDGAHLRLFAHTSSDPTDRPAVDLTLNNPFSDTRWSPSTSLVASDLDDLFIGGDPSTLLWVGVLFEGDGSSSAVLSNLRVEFDHETYLTHLPAIYSEPAPCGDFLLRFLSLIESFQGETEGEIRSLSSLFDPAVISSEFLPWLAGFLALELDENWSDQKKREAIAQAFENYGWRGTARGLVSALKFRIGIEAIVEEPILAAEWWALPADQNGCNCGKGTATKKEKTWSDTTNSILGVTTMLASAHPQGAVLGSTATLDQSHLISDSDYGLPLFVEVADRFSVMVYRGQLDCAETLAKVREVIEAEKPAHTDYHLCIVEPSLRVGYQARVGVDAVVGGGSVPTGLGDERGTILSGDTPGEVGVRSRLGITTRVTG